MTEQGDHHTIRQLIDDDIADIPWLYRMTRVSHYYGDTVRQLLIGAAALMLVTAPYYTDTLSNELPFIVLGTLALVCVSALTSPVKIGGIRADAVVSGVGMVVFEIWALNGYATATALQFLLREILAIIFLFAFYFSTKTLRSMLMKQVVHADDAGEQHSHVSHAAAEHGVLGASLPPHEVFESESEEDAMMRQEHVTNIHDLNEKEKLEYTD